MSDEITKLNLGNNEPIKVPPDDPLQFDRAEYVEPAAARLTCTVCHKAIEQSYHTVNTKVCCTACRTQIETELTSGSGAMRFVRASIFGLLAAALGSAIYYAITAL